MTTKEFVAQAESPRWGLWHDITGACHKLRIVDETITGKYVLDGWAIGLGIMLADKKLVKEIK